MYRTIPRKVRISNKSEIASYKETAALFSRHGLGIAAFNFRGVEFYSSSARVGNTVPITAYFMVSKKEFLAYVDIVRRLDESEQKRLRMVKWMAGR
jgi:hypothetical protein